MVAREGGLDPEQEAMLADSIGLALLVVLETLTPAERLAFVLHDMFSVPFGEIGAIIGPLARRRAPAREPRPAPRPRRPRRSRTPTCGASARWSTPILAAAREGRFDDLVALLDPDVVLRADGGPGIGSQTVRGVEQVAAQAVDPRARWRTSPSRPWSTAWPASSSRATGRRPSSRPSPSSGGRIVEMDFLADPERLAALDLSDFGV